jgi:hypothetical protein
LGLSHAQCREFGAVRLQQQRHAALQVVQLLRIALCIHFPTAFKDQYASRRNSKDIEDLDSPTAPQSRW